MKDFEAKAFDAFKSKARKVKPDQKQGLKPTASSFTTSPQRRSHASSVRQPSEHEQFSVTWRPCISARSSKWCWRCLLVLLTVSMCALYIRFSNKQWQPVLSAVSPGQYLRQIAALHDWKQLATDAVQLHTDLQPHLQACARQLLLPEVKLATHIPQLPWRPPAASRLPAIAALDLNCSRPEHAAACQQAADSNLYEGDLVAPLEPWEDDALLQGSAASPVKAHDAAADLLSSLALDCELQPDTCADVAASTNAYEAAPHSHDSAAESVAAREAAGRAVAEASAYFLTHHAASAGQAGSWAAVTGWPEQRQQDLTDERQEQLLSVTNTYEDVSQTSWQYKRHAEEAGAHYLDVSVLDLDCSPAAMHQDSAVYRECMRSRAINRYETARPGAAEEAAGVPQVGTEELEGEAAAASGDVAAVIGSRRSAPAEAEARRVYYKNPCNSPAAHTQQGPLQYKGDPRGQHSLQRYYKNPANAPATLEVLLAPPRQTHSQAATMSPTARVLQLATSLPGLWLGLAAVMITWCFCEDVIGSMFRQLLGACLPLGAWAARLLRCRAQGGRSAVPRTRSSVLLPCASQELPVPQLMHVEVPLKASLPVLSALASTCSPVPSLVDLASPRHGGNVAASLPTELGENTAAWSGAVPTNGGSNGGPMRAMANQEALLQSPDDIQAACDSPRAQSCAAFRRGSTPVPPSSRASTPTLAAKGE